MNIVLNAPRAAHLFAAAGGIMRLLVKRDEKEGGIMTLLVNERRWEGP